MAAVTSRGFPPLSPGIESFCVCVQARARRGGRARAAVGRDGRTRIVSYDEGALRSERPEYRRVSGSDDRSLLQIPVLVRLLDLRYQVVVARGRAFAFKEVEERLSEDAVILPVWYLLNVFARGERQQVGLEIAFRAGQDSLLQH